jgi:acyl-CoA-binding protein
MGFNYKFDSAKKTDLSEKKKRKELLKLIMEFYKISRKYVIIKKPGIFKFQVLYS